MYVRDCYGSCLSSPYGLTLFTIEIRWKTLRHSLITRYDSVLTPGSETLSSTGTGKRTELVCRDYFHNIYINPKRISRALEILTL